MDPDHLKSKLDEYGVLHARLEEEEHKKLRLTTKFTNIEDGRVHVFDSGVWYDYDIDRIAYADPPTGRWVE